MSVRKTLTTKQKSLIAQARARIARRLTKARLATAIRRVVGRSETKYVASNVDYAGNALAEPWYSNGPIILTSATPAIPLLTQGVGDFQRVGNMINPTSLKVTLKFGFNPVDVDTHSCYVVVYYGVSRDTKTWAAGNNPMGTANFLDNGDGTSVPFSGIVTALNKPIDNKQFIMKRIVFPLSKTEGLQSGYLNPAAQKDNYATSNGRSTKTLTLTFKPPKTLRYNLAADTYPQNYAPFYAVGFCNADSSALDLPGDRELIWCSSRVHMTYKDA